MLGLVIMKNASSANKTHFSDTANGRSLIYILKHKGPKIDPWGTPQTIFSILDLKSSRHTNCFLFVKYDFR